MLFRTLECNVWLYSETVILKYPAVGKMYKSGLLERWSVSVIAGGGGNGQFFFSHWFFSGHSSTAMLIQHHGEWNSPLYHDIQWSWMLGHKHSNV